MQEINSAFHLARTAFSDLVHEWGGTTYTAVFICVLLLAVKYWRNWRSAMNADGKTTLRPTVIVMVLAWTFVFLCAIAHVIYKDHISAREKIQTLAGKNRDFQRAIQDDQKAINGYQTDVGIISKELSTANALNNQYRAAELAKEREPTRKATKANVADENKAPIKCNGPNFVFDGGKISADTVFNVPVTSQLCVHTHDTDMTGNKEILKQQPNPTQLLTEPSRVPKKP
jgi:hypothetical protein